MSLQMLPWERRLQARAYEALHSHTPAEPVTTDRERLERAYAYCETMTATHSRTFYLASGLMLGHKRRAARALYAFCRVSDDLVDEQSSGRQAALDRWRSRVQAFPPPEDDLVALAWADARQRYGVPSRYAEQLIDGVARDLSQTRYETFDDLVDYCYGVASTVGLMAMHIIDFSHARAVSYAIKLGVALQLTNILRDVGEDWRAGRLYLPLEELADFGLTEDDIEAGHVSDRWQAFMRFQITRNRQLYIAAMPGIELLHPNGRFAIAAAAELYRDILGGVEANGYDVFNRRAYVSGWGKLRRLPGIGWRSLHGYPV
jgi:phytoene synthase